MSQELKPLNWKRKPNIGYSVARRSDGGMNVTFTNLSEETIADWREFSFEHLMGSDRLTRNLYDLREVAVIPDRAIKLAIEVNSDPSTRNLRVAVLVASQEVQDAILTVAAGAVASGAAIKIFTKLAEAENWLANSVEQIV